MSIRLMSAIFDSKTLGPTERLVMLALADHADDEGKCYPSILRLCDRTGLSERAVQTNVKRLTEAGYLSVHIGGGKGHANLYFVSPNPAANTPYNAPKPRTICTPQEMHPAAGAPQTPQQVRPNPAADAPEPSLTIKEPSVSRNTGAADELKAWASSPAVESFMAYRRNHKSKALTLTGAKRLAGHLSAIFQGGGDCDDALAMAEEKGWASIEPDWYFKNRSAANGNYNSARPYQRRQSGAHDSMVAGFAFVANQQSHGSGSD